MWLEDLFDRIKYEIWHPIKWAWQRLYRGWDDRVVWSLHSHLAKMMPTWLRRLKEIQHGYPSQFENMPKKWDEVLDIIIGGFEAAEQIDYCAFPAWDWLMEQERERYGRELDIFSPEDHAKMDTVKKETNFREMLKAQETEAMARFEEGMDLFKEHFFDLWD